MIRSRIKEKEMKKVYVNTSIEDVLTTKHLVKLIKNGSDEKYKVTFAGVCDVFIDSVSNNDSTYSRYLGIVQ